MMPALYNHLESGFPLHDAWHCYKPMWEINNEAFKVMFPPGFGTVFSSIGTPNENSNNPVERAAALLHLMVNLEARCDQLQSAAPITEDGLKWNSLFQLCQRLGPQYKKLGDMAYNMANRLLNTGFLWSEPGVWASSVLSKSVNTMSGAIF